MITYRKCSECGQVFTTQEMDKHYSRSNAPLCCGYGLIGVEPFGLKTSSGVKRCLICRRGGLNYDEEFIERNEFIPCAKFTWGVRKDDVCNAFE